MSGRVVEVRRHSLTKKGPERRRGSHLSQAGVELAQKVKGTMGTFDRVITTQVPRTTETALAMGFAVDDQNPVLGTIDDEVLTAVGHHERWQWPEPFVVFARLVREHSATARFGHSQAECWRAIAAALPEGGRALIISHGRIIEAGAVASLPAEDHAAWGPPFGHCEGIHLTWAGSAWTGYELLRVDSEGEAGARSGRVGEGSCLPSPP